MSKIKDFDISDFTVRASSEENKLTSRREEERKQHVIKLAKSSISVERIAEIVYGVATPNFIERLKDEAVARSKRYFQSAAPSTEYERAIQFRDKIHQEVKNIIEEVSNAAKHT